MAVEFTLHNSSKFSQFRSWNRHNDGHPTLPISSFPIRLTVVMRVCSVLLSHCVCIRVLLCESWKKGPALSITKKQGVHKVTTERRKTEARLNRTMCISISPLSTASDSWKKGLSPPSRLIKERICSKQLYLNLSCLLFLQTHTHTHPRRPPLQQPGESIHRSMRTTGLYALVIWAQWTIRRQATDQMLTKGH